MQRDKYKEIDTFFEKYKDEFIKNISKGQGWLKIREYVDETIPDFLMSECIINSRDERKYIEHILRQISSPILAEHYITQYKTETPDGYDQATGSEVKNYIVSKFMECNVPIWTEILKAIDDRVETKISTPRIDQVPPLPNISSPTSSNASISGDDRRKESLKLIAAAVDALDVKRLEKIRAENTAHFTPEEYHAVSKGIERCKESIETIRRRESIRLEQLRFNRGKSTDPELINIYNQQRELQGKSKSSDKLERDWVWGVLTPKTDVSLDLMKYDVKKSVMKKWIKEFYISFEQKSETIDRIYGMHIHILFQFDKEKHYKLGRAKERTESTLNKSFNCWWNEQALTDYEHLSKIDYMRGNKEESKMAKVAVDNEMRKMNGLQSIYTKSNIDTL
jgi:hypothetical protein